MFWYNRWALTGRLVRDPGEVRYLPSGEEQLEFTIAHSRPTGGKSTPPQVAFVDVVTRGRQAVACAKNLRKGSPVLVDGESWQMSYQTAGTITSKKRIILRARIVLFLNLAVDIPPADEPGGVEIPE